MKKYTSLGELLTDYRKINNISQTDFAANLNVDTRTVQRWEKNITLVKPEKEDALVQETLLPHQLIRNLNSFRVISTYYDFGIRKYSLNILSNELPDASWFKEQIEITTDRIRKINFEEDIEYIMRYMQFQKRSSNIINSRLVREAIKLLPELNLIIADDSGYYSGHSIILPLKFETYKKLKNREITEDQLSVGDLVSYTSQEKPVFHEYNVTADCNDDIYYIVASVFKFFRNVQSDNYIYSAFSTRYDSAKLNKQLGMKIIWEDEEVKEKKNIRRSLRFVEGNFKDFLSDL